MTDMTAREAIEQLKIIIFGCDGVQCPYKKQIALRMAIAALEAQVPRVLTKEEAQATKQDTVVWIEYLGNVPRVLAVDAFYYPSYWQQYGKNFRWWTHKPTAEQMAATPWRESK